MNEATLRRVSADYKSRMSKLTPERKRYRNQLCQCCGAERAKHVHEIAPAGQREAMLEYRQAWLALCPTCHLRMHNYADYPPERQLALKAIADPEYFDRVLINKLRGRDEDAISWPDVARHLRMADD